MSTVLGIDIGSGGAIAIMTVEGGLIDALDMPCLNDGPPGRRAVNGPLLAELIANYSIAVLLSASLRGRGPPLTACAKLSSTTGPSSAGGRPMSERERLPDRRGAELVDFEHEGRRGRASATPSQREVE
jgi:hypothetical protein